MTVRPISFVILFALALAAAIPSYLIIWRHAGPLFGLPCAAMAGLGLGVVAWRLLLALIKALPWRVAERVALYLENDAEPRV